MKTLHLLALAAIATLFASCKASQPTGPTGGPAPSIQDVRQILNLTDSTFIQFANVATNTPEQAIILTENWLQTQPNVQSAYDVDSAYLYIVLKSGLTTVYSFNQLDTNGLSLNRGGGAPRKPALMELSNRQQASPSSISAPSSHVITNKNVLIYCAPYSEFYGPGEMQTVLDLFNNSGLGFDVTLDTGFQCTYQIIDNLSNYGLVILDTHGEPDAFSTGPRVILSKQDTTESALAASIDAQLGAGTYSKIIAGDLRFGNTNASIAWLAHFHARYSPNKDDTMRIDITSQHVSSLSNLTNTIIVGNMCYSGAIVYTEEQNSYNGLTTLPGIAAAFTRVNPRSYYCYGYLNGYSAKVPDDFAKQMEDSLVQAFVINFDSTGSAYLKTDNTQFYDPRKRSGKSGDFYFKHFGADDYSYNDSLLDTRDGQSYKIVPIGSQIWMAQNLNYNAPGSMCYDNDPRNGAVLGRLYPWYVAMAGAPSDSSNPGKVQGVCPKGWHIPSLSEWNQLFAATGGISSFSKSGNALESPLRDTAAGGWLPSTINFTPSNSSGFSALPGGGFFWDTTSPPLGTPTFHFDGKSQQGFFLTSTLVPAGQVWAGRVNAITFGINGTVSIIQRQGNPDDPIDPYQPSMNASCRCVKDP